MSDLCTLDTDTLSEVLKNQNQDVVANAAAYLREHGGFAVSGMVRFEIGGKTETGPGVGIRTNWTRPRFSRH